MAEIYALDASYQRNLAKHFLFGVAVDLDTQHTRMRTAYSSVHIYICMHCHSETMVCLLMLLIQLEMPSLCSILVYLSCIYNLGDKNCQKESFERNLNLTKFCFERKDTAREFGMIQISLMLIVRFHR